MKKFNKLLCVALLMAAVESSAGKYYTIRVVPKDQDPQKAELLGNRTDREGGILQLVVAHVSDLSLPWLLEKFTDPDKKNGETSVHSLIGAHTAGDILKNPKDCLGEKFIYLIDQLKGIKDFDQNANVVYEMVDLKDRAHHNGLSAWGNFGFTEIAYKGDSTLCAGRHQEKGINSISIGYMIVNPHDEQWYKNEGYKGPTYRQEIGGVPNFRFGKPTYQQLDVFADLARQSMKQFQIPLQNVLGQGDSVFDGRKNGPGALFDWTYLAQKGVGYMPKVEPFYGEWKIGEVEGLLRKIGFVLPHSFDKDKGHALMCAIQMFSQHWVTCIYGEVDPYAAQLKQWELFYEKGIENVVTHWLVGALKCFGEEGRINLTLKQQPLSLDSQPSNNEQYKQQLEQKDPKQQQQQQSDQQISEFGEYQIIKAPGQGNQENQGNQEEEKK